MSGHLVITGHGVVDVFVVFGSLAFMIWTILRRRRWFLFALPTLLTINFFIPTFSNITPGRIAPIIILGWLLFAPKPTRPLFRPVWEALFLILTIGSILASFFILDGGPRALVRGLFYIGLFAQLYFVAHECRDPRKLKWAYYGLIAAAVIHGGYALYQLLAFHTGLPFRSIARAWGADVALVEGTIRVNGLASEPKRFAFVVAAGACALLGLAPRLRPVLKGCALFTAGVFLALTAMSFSASYVFAIVTTVLLCSLLSIRIAKSALYVAILMASITILVPGARSIFLESLPNVVERKQEEIQLALDTRYVYRQEFYAQEYLKRYPIAALTGVGMGRYNDVFYHEFGPGAGRSGQILLPMNSQLFESLYDLGIIGTLLIFGFCLAICSRLFLLPATTLLTPLKLGLFASCAFLTVQSLFVQSWPLLAFCLGVSIAFIEGFERAKVSQIPLRAGGIVERRAASRHGRE